MKSLEWMPTPFSGASGSAPEMVTLPDASAIGLSFRGMVFYTLDLRADIRQHLIGPRVQFPDPQHRTRSRQLVIAWPDQVIQGHIGATVGAAQVSHLQRVKMRQP